MLALYKGEISYSELIQMGYRRMIELKALRSERYIEEQKQMLAEQKQAMPKGKS